MVFEFIFKMCTYTKTKFNLNSSSIVSKSNIEKLLRSLLLIGAQIDSIWNQMFYMHLAERTINWNMFTSNIFKLFGQKHLDVLKKINIVNLHPDI